MKINDCFIECLTKESRKDVESILKSNGLRFVGTRVSDCLGINVLSGTYTHTYKNGVKKFTCKEFIQKHLENEMIKKIHQAKKELGLNNSELSLKMSKSRPYIAKMLNQPQSEKVQNKVIAELDKLIDGKNYAQTMKDEVKPLIESVKNTSSTLWNGILEGKDKEISDLKKIIESKDLAISGLIKQNDEAKKIHDKDVKALADKDDQFMVLAESLEQSNRELDYFVNQYKQSEEDFNSIKSKIKRERIIILIVIAILTALFFLKGSIGG